MMSEPQEQFQNQKLSSKEKRFIICEGSSVKKTVFSLLAT